MSLTVIQLDRLKFSDLSKGSTVTVTTLRGSSFVIFKPETGGIQAQNRVEFIFGYKNYASIKLLRLDLSLR
jgi:hypothetical protein